MSLRKIHKKIGMAVFVAAVMAATVFICICLIRVFVCDTFTVKGDSMSPTLKNGEKVRVNKLIMGARIYTSFDFSDPELKCFRMPGSGSLDVGDIAAFNYPYGWDENRIGFRINYVYIKRCIGCPGDTLSIINGFYSNSRFLGRTIGNAAGQEELLATPDSVLAQSGIYMTAFPYSQTLDWDIRNMGPLYIPRQGKTVKMAPAAFDLYKRVIEYETGVLPRMKNGHIYLGDKKMDTYTFAGDWYFFGGDNILDSRDSRYFGFVPEDFIIGVVPDRRKRKHRRYDKGIRFALECAGDNRHELEEFLEHYSDSSRQKQAAAEYLVRNMTFHKSYPAGPYLEYCREIDSLFLNVRDKDSLKVQMRVVSDKYRQILTPKPDVQTITAEYLIRDMEYSFDLWETSPFLNHLDFGQFCEYVLPYKCIGLQPVTDWKEKYHDKYRGDMDLFPLFSDLEHNALKAVEISQESLKANIVADFAPVDCIPLLDISALEHMTLGSCTERSVLGVLSSRSIGIPVAIDMSPGWADRGGPHFWNNVLTERRRNIDYDPFIGTPVDRHYDDTPIAKIYRYTYKPDGTMLEALKTDKFLPPGFSYFFIRDVTAEYGKTVGLEMKVDRSSGIRAKFAYLCIFGSDGWQPVAISKIRHRYVSFPDIGRGVLYMIAVYDNGRQLPASLPFIVDTKGEVHEIKYEPGRFQDITLTRKFPAFQHVFAIRERLKEATISVSDSPDFNNSGIVCTIPEENPLSGSCHIAEEEACRYLKVSVTPGNECDLAELYFFDRAGGAIGTPRILTEIPDTAGRFPENILDGDPFTYYMVGSPSDEVIFDFGKPVSIGKISFIKRGDSNDICPGQTYELYFWDNRQWVLHDSKVADDVRITFQNVPSDALYYIKCPTYGRQNRTFMCTNDKIIWY